MAAFSAKPRKPGGRREPRRRRDDARRLRAVPAARRHRPRAGELFDPEDDREGAAATLVLSHALWQSEFGADPAVLGKTVRLDDESYTVIGVMPPDFSFPSRDAQAWRPFRFRGHGLRRPRQRLPAGASAKLQVRRHDRPGAGGADDRSPSSSSAATRRRTFGPGRRSSRCATSSPAQTRLLLTALFGASLCGAAHRLHQPGQPAPRARPRTPRRAGRARRARRRPRAAGAPVADREPAARPLPAASSASRSPLPRCRCSTRLVPVDAADRRARDGPSRARSSRRSSPAARASGSASSPRSASAASPDMTRPARRHAVRDERPAASACAPRWSSHR